MADVPDGLYVPGVGLHQLEVPSWNTLTEEWAEPIFEVARSHLQDDGAIFLFHPDIPHVREQTDSFAEAYGFTCLHDWWGINEMLLTSHLDNNKTVCKVSFEIVHH